MQPMDTVNLFWHPLATAHEKVQLPDGRIEEVLNAWAIASLLSHEIVTNPGNKKAETTAIAMCKETGITEQEARRLIKTCRKCDWAAIKRLQALIATGFQDACTKAFEKQQGK